MWANPGSILNVQPSVPTVALLIRICPEQDLQVIRRHMQVGQSSDLQEIQAFALALFLRRLSRADFTFSHPFTTPRSTPTAPPPPPNPFQLQRRLVCGGKGHVCVECPLSAQPREVLKPRAPKRERVGDLLLQTLGCRDGEGWGAGRETGQGLAASLTKHTNSGSRLGP